MANPPPMNTITGNYKIMNVLGEGCFGHVVKCIKLDTKETVAVKVLKQRHSQPSDTREVFILEKLRCLNPDVSNIVRCHEWFQCVDRTFMVFEMLHMSLHDYMSKRKWVPSPLNGIRTIIKDLATALNALKGVGLIHTDLKLDNIMLVDHHMQPFRVKLIDFGLALKTSEAGPGVRVQALWHRSPEIILGLSFTEAIDIWSLGTTMAQMLLGFPLFPGTHEYDVLRFMIDLLGEPPKRLLNGGINTPLFFHGKSKYMLFMQWGFLTPLEFQAQTRIKAVESRRYQFSSLEELKTMSLHQENSTEAADRNACVELLKEMLQMDPRKRTTPNNILAHPFITRSYLSPNNSCHNESAQLGSRIISNKDTAETKADRGSGTCQPSCNGPLKLPPGVIMVLPAENTMQEDEASKHRNAISLQAVQMSLVPPSSHVEAPVLKQASSKINPLQILEVGEPKKKRGIRRFFSTLKRKCLSCFCVPKVDCEG